MCDFSAKLARSVSKQRTQNLQLMLEANRHINEKDDTEVQLEILALGQFAQQNVFMFSPEEF